MVIRTALAWLTMAALCGLLGFVIVYHYANYERPTEHFAIVVDAGSTQTRSNLYSIELDGQQLADIINAMAELEEDNSSPSLRDGLSLTRLLRVRQISSCVNGGPLASIEGPHEADLLMLGCIEKFTHLIKQLQFDEGDETADSGQLQGASELSRTLAKRGGRVSSVTHFYLGATAGMRALAELNQTRVALKISWIDEAIGRSNEMLSQDSPFVNKAFVGIISGQQEAAFGWLSVNFLSDKLTLKAPSPSQISFEPLNKHDATPIKQAIYSISDQEIKSISSEGPTEPATIGTLELGGASAQLAFRLPSKRSPILSATRGELQTSSWELFNGHYELATRSDLCLGMSQAVLRVQHILLHEYLAQAGGAPTSLELANVCMQRGARLELQRNDLARLTSGACMQSANNSEAESLFKIQVANLQQVVFVGQGKVRECDYLLAALIEPNLCAQHFSLCPKTKLDSAAQSIPKAMPFVTISGYNHALSVLNLSPKISGPNEELDATVERGLGGYSVDHEELITKTRQFCETDFIELTRTFPKVKKPYREIICLQLVYINKLLTEFYNFKPNENNWDKVKFMIFAPEKSTLGAGGPAELAHQRNDPKRDIGWTLGLLLNATSDQLASNSMQQAVFFHHSSSVSFVLRSTLFLMFACCLISIGLLVVGIVQVRQAQRRANAYVIHQQPSNSPAAHFYTGPSEWSLGGAGDPPVSGTRFDRLNGAKKTRDKNSPPDKTRSFRAQQLAFTPATSAPP